MAAPCRKSYPLFSKLFSSILLFLCITLTAHKRDEVCTRLSCLPSMFFNCGTELQPPVPDINISFPDSEVERPVCVVVWLRQRIKLAKLQLLVVNKDSHSHRLVMLLIGGVENNPGPRRPRFPCTVCSKACKTNHQALACDCCDKWTHKNCVNMSTSSYLRLGDSDEQWKCPGCRSTNNSKLYTIPDAAVDKVSRSLSQSQQTHDTSPSHSQSPRNTSLRQLSSIPSDISSTSPECTDTEEAVTEHSLDQSTPVDADIGMTSSPKPLTTTTTRRNGDNKKRNLRILNINFQSAMKKGKHLEAIIDSCDPDIIIGTETWLNSRVKSAEIIPNFLGYDVHRRDRPDSHGGVLIAAKKDLELQKVEKSDKVELISGTIKATGRKKMIIAAFYRPPNRTDVEYLNDSKKEITALRNQSKRNIFIVGGDFNLPDIDWPTLSTKGHQYPARVSENFLDILVENNLEQQVDFPTRENKILDLIMTSHPTFKTRCKPLPSVGNSDHDIVLYDTSLAPYRPKPARRKIYLWKKMDMEGLKHDLQEYAQTFKPDTSLPDVVERAWRDFKEVLQQTVEKRVPSKTTPARHSNPWIDTSIRRAIRRKQRAHAKARKTGNKRDADRYKRIQAETKYEIRQANKRYMEEIVSSDFRTNSKKFWAYVKSKGAESAGVPPLKNNNGFLKSDNLGKAEILNDQFKSVFTEEDTSNVPSKGKSPYPDMPGITVREKGVRILLQKLRPDTATGPDSIPAYILKTAAVEIAPLLTKIFQLSLDTGQVPTDWKQANVVPIYKNKGDKHMPANYRPVSLTSITCKVLEHILHSNIMDHFDHHKILSDAQHGFRKRRSCETQLLTTIHTIAKDLAQEDPVDVVLLDFSKAFDKVPHMRLLHKLQYYGVRNNALSWIRSFLSGRSQQVVLEGARSSSAAVRSGVPQGTVLGPLLFLAYINDLPDVVKSSNVRLFADDSSLFRKIHTQQDKDLLQKDLTHLEDWENTWQMSFNASKCNTLRIFPSKQNRSNHISSDYILHGQVLETVKSTEYLGVTMTDDLTWSKHVATVAAKGSSKVGFLRRNFRDCTTKVRSATYTTMVRPKLEYASSVWDPTKKEDVGALEMVQRSAARYACNNYRDRSPGSVTQMLQTLEWDTLEKRRYYNRQTMLYKISNKLVGIDSSSFYKQSDPRTRGPKRIHQEKGNHKALFPTFFPRTISEWNLLPTATTSAPSLEVFRRRLGCSPQDLQSVPTTP